jgi:hypothetical protein
MNSRSRDIPRFLPTLTEVVDPRELSQFQPAQPNHDVAQMVDLVQRQLRPIFERRLQEECEQLVRSTLSEQWNLVSTRLREEMDLLVQQAVLDAMRQSNNPKTS